MRLLPTEQKEKTQRALEEFEKTGKFFAEEPCDCGSHIRHNNGGNYHSMVWIQKDDKKYFIKNDSTCDMNEPAEWYEISKEDAIKEIKGWADCL